MRGFAFSLLMVTVTVAVMSGVWSWCSPAAHAQSVRPPRRVAFLVGVNHYDKRGFDDLKWAENDVNELAQEFRELGFDRVVVMTGAAEGDLRPTRAAILQQLRALLSDVTKNDVVMVVLCGHGQQLDVVKEGMTHNDGFFAPVDAVVNDPTSMVSLSDLTDDVLNKNGGKNLVLVDACRDGVVDRDRGVRKRGIQGIRVSLPEDTAILFSCRAGQKSDEHDQLKHGVFSHSVLESLRAAKQTGRPLTWDGLVADMKDRMAELVGADRQEPIAAGSIGRIVLGRNAARDVPSPRPGPTPSTSTKSFTIKGVQFTFRWCPPGKFTMGSPESEADRDDDENQVSVTLTQGYWMLESEVTQAMYVAVMNKELDWSKYGQGPSYPVYNVSYTEAVEFCTRLTTLAREQVSGFRGEIRFPTEAEWEYACRAGTTTAYSFGDDTGKLGEYAVFGLDSGKGNQQVKSKKPNRWGLYDMHGSVWEWCGDWYADQLAGGRDPVGPGGGSDRVARGGGWIISAVGCRSANRSGYSPEGRNVDLGFRCAARGWGEAK